MHDDTEVYAERYDDFLVYMYVEKYHDLLVEDAFGSRKVVRQLIQKLGIRVEDLARLANRQP